MNELIPVFLLSAAVIILYVALRWHMEKLSLYRDRDRRMIKVYGLDGYMKLLMETWENKGEDDRQDSKY